MRVIVTGSNGFIGKRVCAELEVVSEATVIRSPSREETRRLNSESWGEGGALLPPVDCVVCCAGDARKFWAAENEEEARVRSVGAAEEAVALAQKSGAGAIVLVSSVDAAFDGSPPSKYSAIKLLAEKTIKMSALPKRKVIIRCSNVWGPGSKKGPLHDLAEAAASNAPWSDIWAHPDAHYDFIHVCDVASAVARGVDHLPSGTYYAIAGRPTTMRRVVEALGEGEVDPARLRFHPEVRAAYDGWKEVRLSSRGSQEPMESYGWSPIATVLDDDESASEELLELLN